MQKKRQYFRDHDRENFAGSRIRTHNLLTYFHCSYTFLIGFRPPPGFPTQSGGIVVAAIATVLASNKCP